MSVQRVSATGRPVRTLQSAAPGARDYLLCKDALQRWPHVAVLRGRVPARPLRRHAGAQEVEGIRLCGDAGVHISGPSEPPGRGANALHSQVIESATTGSFAVRWATRGGRFILTAVHATKPDTAPAVHVRATSLCMWPARSCFVRS
jgi:hypothetical protein